LETVISNRLQKIRRYRGTITQLEMMQFGPIMLLIIIWADMEQFA
jgi:hypothetical protein